MTRQGTSASVFGYPAVLMDVTRQVSTAVPRVDERQHKAPINQLSHLREFPDATFTDVVSPNADTLYSFAFLDLKEEPIILSVPDMGDRYYLMEMLDAWTNVFASPGTRTTGSGKGDFALVGPFWNGALPDGVKEIRSPTNLVWIIGRTQTNGKKDYAAVHAIQDQYALTPLRAWGRHYTRPIDVPIEPGTDIATPPAEQVARMDATAFFRRLSTLMKDNPPSPSDSAALGSFGELGITPGKPFDPDEAARRAVDQDKREGLRSIVEEAKRPHGVKSNGWERMTNIGAYGTDYLWRAVVALIGLGANLPDDAVYPRATTDVDGQPLDGKDRYVIRFAKGELPPVHAFWSVTMYNAKQSFVANPIDRYAIGDRDELKLGDDGSLTLYIQHDSPGKDRESNWLPAPKTGSFNLMARLYWPEKAILDGTWNMPGIERVR